MTATRLTHLVRAPRAAVYGAFLDGGMVAQWMVPNGMTARVHRFEPHEGGTFRISLTYDTPAGTGKTDAQTDTYHGRFVRLVPGERIEEVLAFESGDVAMQGEMRLIVTFADRDGGTEVSVVHDDLPPGLDPRENDLGWQLSLAKLSAILERP